MNLDLKSKIRTIPDFPEKGIMFRDITTILSDPAYLKEAIDQICDKLKGIDFDYIIGPESRGFIFGTPAAYILNKGFIPVRKKGKLPFGTRQKTYDLEYGTATIEIHSDAIKQGDKAVIVDDLLATGGTCKAIAELCEELGGKVEATVFLIELEALNGRAILEDYHVESIIKY